MPDYYWTAYQTEWATDILFNTPADLAEIYPALVRHATLHFQSPDVLRFFARKLHGNFTGNVITSFKQRPEGVRVKHWLNGNSIKMYDRPGLLRVETTLAKTTDFKVFRPDDRRPDGPLAWRPLRKGVVDLYRRAELSQHANERYLDALSVVDDSTPLHRLLDQVSRPVYDQGRRARALRIGDPDDLVLLQAVARGEFATAASAIATSGVSSIPRRPPPHPPRFAASPRRSPGNSVCSAPTASSTRSPRPTATSSVPKAASSPRLSSPPGGLAHPTHRHRRVAARTTRQSQNPETTTSENRSVGASPRS